MPNLIPGLTRSQVEEYYKRPEVQQLLLPQFRNRNVTVIQSGEDGTKILKRKNPSGYIKIPSVKGLEFLTDRRHTEFHPATGKTTTHFVVDIDPGPDAAFGDAKRTTRAVVRRLREIYPGQPEISFSGGTGFYVKHPIGYRMDTGAARRRLQKTLEGIPGTTFAKPQGSEVRLDMVAMKPTGSVRAVGSLNAETGLRAMDVGLDALGKFKPEMAKVSHPILWAKTARDWSVMLEKMRTRRDPDGLEKCSQGFAPGLPSKTNFTPILPQNADDPFLFALQKHKTDRSGGRKHIDMRLVNEDTGVAHSWALPKAQLPKRKGEKFLAVQQPDHEAGYATGFQGRIPEGYGAGTVSTNPPKPMDILKADIGSIVFEVLNGSRKVYNLHQMGQDPTQWLIQKLDARRHSRGQVKPVGIGDAGVEGPEMPKAPSLPKIAQPPKIS